MPNVEYPLAALALFVVVLALGWLPLRPRHTKRPHRTDWWLSYGSFYDPIGTVWLARDQAHASQNVMTRLL
jgi:hypothetical protein